MAMKVHQIYTKSPLRNFTYVIEGDQGHCYVIDPFDGQACLDYISELGGFVRGIINTHEHDDHTCGNEVIVSKTACVVYAHPNAAKKNKYANKFLNENEKIEIDDSSYLKVIDTPGHTLAHLCFLLFENEKNSAVFTGDTLFNAGIGHCRLGGDINSYFDTMENKFKRLADDVIVYPGHDYLENNLNFTLSVEPSNEEARVMLEFAKTIDWQVMSYQNNMGQERSVNSFLRLDSEEIAHGLNISGSSGQTKRKEVFIKLRQLRDKW
jgi:hydroxyacylglutathione hydrolase